MNEAKRRPSRVRKWLFRLGLLVCLAITAFYFRAPLLTGLANLWVVDEPLTRADSIVILGGGLESRPFEAARLYHQDLAPKILIVTPNLGPTPLLGVIVPDADVTEQILLRQDVPKTNIFVIGAGSLNTYDESIAVRHWVETNHPRSLILTTDVFHTRRARWVFRKQLAGLNVGIQVRAVPVRAYTTGDWWRKEQGIVAFQNEVLKYAYYRLKY